MKVFFSLKPPSNSFGGGAFFVKNITNYLKNKNIEVTFELEKNIDIIFIIDPRKGNPEYKKYSVVELLEYKKTDTTHYSIFIEHKELGIVQLSEIWHGAAGSTCMFDLNNREVVGNYITDLGEDFRDYLRRRGIKIFTGKPFRSLGTI